MGKNGGGGGGATKAFQRRKRSKYEDKDGINTRRIRKDDKFKAARLLKKKPPKSPKDKLKEAQENWQKQFDIQYELGNSLDRWIINNPFPESL